MTQRSQPDKPSSPAPPEPIRPIGARLRHARLLKGLRLKDVAAQVGCTEGLVSKIERDKASPSLKLLHRLIGVLDTNITALFAAERMETLVQRVGERPHITMNPMRTGPGILLEGLNSFVEGCLLQAHIHIVQPGGGSDGAIEHEGEEVGYVLEGEFHLEVAGEQYHLKPGDSFHFHSHLPHAYRNPGKVMTRILWVSTPATF